MATLSNTSTFEAPKYSQHFSPFVPLAAWLWAAPPEATHRCIAQRGTATIRSCSGSSRPRQPWMLSTEMAAASDEDSGGKSLEALDRCQKRMKYSWLKFLSSLYWILLSPFEVDKVSAKTSALVFCVVLCDHDC